MMKKLIITVVAILSLFPALAQTRKISGVVRDENGDRMPGAIVVVKSGGPQGSVATSATTDASGQYTVECKDGDYISVNFMGYEEALFPVKGKRTLDVILVPDNSMLLDEVVVIGYGAVKKADLTGSVTSVKMGEIRNEPVLSIDQALQGRVAGLEITSTDGEPGSDSVIRIRGSRSLSAASNDPLIVVDGITDAISSLNLVDFDNLELHRLANEYVVVTNGLHVNLATRQECLSAENVNNHATFRTALDKALNDFLVVECFVDTVPRLSSTSLLVGKFQLTVLVFGSYYIYLYGITHFQIGIVAELSCRNDTIALETNRNNNFTFVNTFNDAFYDFALLHSIEGVVISGGKFFL